MRRSRYLADRWFRGWGVVALCALAVTGIMLLARLEGWRFPFVIAHLAALLALVPLAIVLLVHAFAVARAEETSLAQTLVHVARHDLRVTVLVLLVLAAVAVSLSQFDNGIRALRTAANLTAVAGILALVALYLRAGWPARPTRRSPSS